MDRWTVLCEPPWGRTLGDGVWGCACSSLSLHLPPLFSLVWLCHTATYGRMGGRVPASLWACTTPPFSDPPSPAPPLGVGRALLCHSCTGFRFSIPSENQPHPEVLAQHALVARDLHLSQVPGDRDAAGLSTRLRGPRPRARHWLQRGGSGALFRVPRGLPRTPPSEQC